MRRIEGLVDGEWAVRIAGGTDYMGLDHQLTPGGGPCTVTLLGDYSAICYRLCLITTGVALRTESCINQETRMDRITSTALAVTVAVLAACASPDPTSKGKPEFMVIGIDNKATWGEDGKLQLLPPARTR